MGSRELPDLHRQAVAIVVSYAVVSAAWILLSDRLLAWWAAGDAARLARLGELKGVGFVLTTAGLLYWLLRRASVATQHTLDALRCQGEKLSRHDLQLRRTEAILESTNDAVVGVSPEGLVSEWNQAAERMLGYSAEEIFGKPMERLIPAERIQDAAALRIRASSGAQVESMETSYQRKDGSLFEVSLTLSPIWAVDEAGRPSSELLGVSAILRDITERKKTEARAEAERRFAQSLVEAMPGIFYFYDENGQFLRWNENFQRVSGYSAREIAGMHPLDLFTGADRQHIQRCITEVFDVGESSAEAALVPKNGQAVPYFFTGRRIELDGRRCLIGVGVDITQRTLAEQKVRKSEERFRSTLDGILEGCQILDFDWRYLYVNDAAVVQNRRPRSDLIGARMPDVWPGIESSDVFAVLERCMRERTLQQEQIEFLFSDDERA